MHEHGGQHRQRCRHSRNARRKFRLAEQARGDHAETEDRDIAAAPQRQLPQKEHQNVSTVTPLELLFLSD